MGLAFERAGSGPPLVLLHGVGHRRQAWGAVLDRLTPHRDVIAVDLPGHGESPPLPDGATPVLPIMLDAVQQNQRRTRPGAFEGQSHGKLPTDG